MLYNDYRAVKGFSLIELLVGIVVGSLLIIGGYDMLTAQQKTYAVHDDVFEMQQNLRIAMEKIGQDLTLAGFGKPSHLGRPAWPQLNNEPANTINYSVQIVPGAAGAKLDTLDIVGCLGAAVGHPPVVLTAGATSITLPGGEGAHFNTTTKSNISIGGAEDVLITAINGDILSIDSNPAFAGSQGPVNGYSAGMAIYAVTHVTYAIDASGAIPVLTADKHQGAGPQPVAQFIEGMELALSGSNAVTITLTGRTRNRDRTTNQYIRVQSQDQVFLRNLPNISS